MQFCRKAFLLGVAILVFSTGVAARQTIRQATQTTILHGSDHTIFGAMRRMGCRDEWFSSVIRDSHLADRDLNHLPAGRIRLAMPKGCRGVAPAAVRLATNRILREELLRHPQARQPVSPPQPTIVTPTPLPVNVVPSVVRHRKFNVSKWDALEIGLLTGIFFVGLAWILWWWHLNNVAVIAYRTYYYRVPYTGQRIAFQLKQLPLYRHERCGTNVNIFSGEGLRRHISRYDPELLLKRDPLPASLANAMISSNEIHGI